MFGGDMMDGFWHTDMAQPVTPGGETYGVCLDCGARRRPSYF
jgi:hypothetical protein